MTQARRLRACVAALLGVGAGLTVALLVASLDAALFHAPAAAPALVVAVAGGLALAAVLSGLASLVAQVRLHRRIARVMDRHAVRPGVVADPTPRAFCVGLIFPRVVVTAGAIEQLDDDELQAVVDHERAHARRRDPLRQVVTRALADALFFCPGARQLADRSADLAELDADAAADPRSLASAMLRFEHVSAERVERLAGRPPAWRIAPATLLAGGLVVATAGLAALLISDQTGGHPLLLGRLVG